MVYNPYGEVFLLNPDWTEQLGTPLVPWQHLFQGLKFTEATGLGYVRNRDYSPTLGRFIELDPIGFDAGDNNWYRFVGNEPVGRVDPSGLTRCYMPQQQWVQEFEMREFLCLQPGWWFNPPRYVSCNPPDWRPVPVWRLKIVYVEVPCCPVPITPPPIQWGPAAPGTPCPPGFPCFPPGHPNAPPQPPSSPPLVPIPPPLVPVLP